MFVRGFYEKLDYVSFNLVLMRFIGCNGVKWGLLGYIWVKWGLISFNGVKWGSMMCTFIDIYFVVLLQFYHS